mmetsp:Transcript_5332/g.13510  ORF Transcript_5332/g.13510 Transcript_5332/m.13510 type:complete len:316 (-) Transcript_5332:419-1366(-)
MTASRPFRSCLWTSPWSTTLSPTLKSSPCRTDEANFHAVSTRLRTNPNIVGRFQVRWGSTRGGSGGDLILRTLRANIHAPMCSGMDKMPMGTLLIDTAATRPARCPVRDRRAGSASCVSSICTRGQTRAGTQKSLLISLSLGVTPSMFIRGILMAGGRLASDTQYSTFSGSSTNDAKALRAKRMALKPTLVVPKLACCLIMSFSHDSLPLPALPNPTSRSSPLKTMVRLTWATPTTGIIVRTRRARPALPRCSSSLPPTASKTSMFPTRWEWEACSQWELRHLYNWNLGASSTLSDLNPNFSSASSPIQPREEAT